MARARAGNSLAARVCRHSAWRPRRCREARPRRSGECWMVRRCLRRTARHRQPARRSERRRRSAGRGRRRPAASGAASMPTKCMVQMPTARKARRAREQDALAGVCGSAQTGCQPEPCVSSQDRDHHRERDQVGIVPYEHLGTDRRDIHLSARLLPDESLHSKTPFAIHMPAGPYRAVPGTPRSWRGKQFRSSA